MGQIYEVCILDFGTGAGAYLLYLASYFKDNENIDFYGTEINPRAEEFCNFNIELNGLKDKIKICNIDILTKTNEEIKQSLGISKFDLIIANPPYVPIPLEIQSEYPEWAKAGEDGLAISGKILKKSEDFLQEDGKLLMVTYSLGDEKTPNDIFKNIPRNKMQFFISHIYPPVWIGFNQSWGKENPMPVKRLSLRFNHGLKGIKGSRDRFIESWLAELNCQNRDYLHHLFVEGKRLKDDNKPPYFFFRRLDQSDLSQMLECEEKSWPSSLKASLENLAKRLTTYPEGVWGGFVPDMTENKLNLVGFGTSQIVEYFPHKDNKKWTVMTMNGDISKTHNPKGNTLHLVSGSVIPEFRQQGIWHNLIILRILQAYFEKLNYVIAHSRIPYYQRDGKDQPVQKYAPHDPCIKLLSSLGFEIREIIKDCADDPESNNYGVLMLKEVCRWDLRHIQVA